MRLLTFNGHGSNDVNCVAWSSDSKLVASGGDDNRVLVWDASKGAQVMEGLKGHSRWIYAVIFNAATTRIFSASQDKTIRIWEVGSGRQIEVFTGHTDFVNSVAWSADGKFIVSTSDDETVRVWAVHIQVSCLCLLL
jgi:WD40 repeat protein